MKKKNEPGLFKSLAKKMRESQLTKEKNARVEAIKKNLGIEEFTKEYKEEVMSKLRTYAEGLKNKITEDEKLAILKDAYDTRKAEGELNDYSFDDYIKDLDQDNNTVVEFEVMSLTMYRPLRYIGPVKVENCKRELPSDERQIWDRFSNTIDDYTLFCAATNMLTEFVSEIFVYTNSINMLYYAAQKLFYCMPGIGRYMQEWVHEINRIKEYIAPWFGSAVTEEKPKIFAKNILNYLPVALRLLQLSYTYAYSYKYDNFNICYESELFNGPFNDREKRLIEKAGRPIYSDILDLSVKNIKVWEAKREEYKPLMGKDLEEVYSLAMAAYNRLIENAFFSEKEDSIFGMIRYSDRMLKEKHTEITRVYDSLNIYSNDCMSAIANYSLLLKDYETKYGPLKYTKEDFVYMRTEGATPELETKRKLIIYNNNYYKCNPDESYSFFNNDIWDEDIKFNARDCVYSKDSKNGISYLRGILIKNAKKHIRNSKDEPYFNKQDRLLALLAMQVDADETMRNSSNRAIRENFIRTKYFPGCKPTDFEKAVSIAVRLAMAPTRKFVDVALYRALREMFISFIESKGYDLTTDPETEMIRDKEKIFFDYPEEAFAFRLNYKEDAAKLSPPMVLFADSDGNGLVPENHYIGMQIAKLTDNPVLKERISFVRDAGVISVLAKHAHFVDPNFSK